MTNLSTLIDGVVSEIGLAPDVRKRLKLIQQLLMANQNEKDNTIYKLQQELDRKSRLAEKYLRMQPLLLEFDEVLGRIANDTIN